MKVFDVLAFVKDLAIANTGGRLEIRYVNDRGQALLNAEVGLPCRGCYTQDAEVTKVLSFLKKVVPKDFMPKKLYRRIYEEA